METSSKLTLWLASLVAALLVGFTALLLPNLTLGASAVAAQPRGVIPVGNEKPCGAEGGIPCDRLMEMEVRDVVPLHSAATHAVVLVAKETGAVLPIFVDESSAVAIALRLSHQQSPHPLAQDLLDRLVEKLGGQVTEVRIDDVREDVFHGRVFISQGNKKLELDARPSDSIAMALSRGVKIFASQKVLAQAGITRQEIDQLREGAPPGLPGEDGPGVGGSGPPDQDDGMPLIPPGKGTEIHL
ncbi:MAG: bifunctional nuclease family protein [Myxococcota bacterium]|nr:bifunctional nuclease family protein [Myxococcota bacterium]